MEILNYKCPNCSAGLEFNSKTQKMACEYCGNSYTVEELEELEEQKEEPLKEEDSRGHWEGFDPESGRRRNFCMELSFLRSRACGRKNSRSACVPLLHESDDHAGAVSGYLPAGLCDTI